MKSIPQHVLTAGREDAIRSALRPRRAGLALVGIVAVATMMQTLLNPITALVDGAVGWDLALPPWAALLTVGVGCVAQASALLLAYRWPILALLATIGCYLALAVILSIPNWLTGMQIVIAGALFLLAARRTTRVALAWLALTIVVVLAFLTGFVVSAGAPIGTIVTFVAAQGITLVALTAGGTSLGIWWRAQARTTADARASLERAREEEAAQLEHARIVERARVAQELHDVAGQHLSGMLSLADAARGMATEHPERALELMDEIRVEGKFAAASVYAALGDLREDTGETPERTPTLEALPSLIDYWAGHGIPAALDTPLRLAELPAVVSTTAYRGAQEALTNAAKHAPGAPVQLTLDRVGGGLLLVIENETARQSEAPHAKIGLGWGLEGLRHRVDLLHGRVDAGPTSAGGWRVRIEIPLNQDVPAPAQGSR